MRRQCGLRVSGGCGGREAILIQDEPVDCFPFVLFQSSSQADDSHDTHTQNKRQHQEGPAATPAPPGFGAKGRADAGV